MADQPGNRIPTIPNFRPYESTKIEENPIKYEKGVESGDASKGGANDWVSHPHPENQFTIDSNKH